MKKLLLFLALLVGAPAWAQTTVLFTDVDLDATSYTFYTLCSPGSVTFTASVCVGQGRFEVKGITTSGSSSTTVTSVASNAAFNELLAGDEIEIYNSEPTSVNGRERRLITARASANSVTVDSAVTIQSGGKPFAWWKLVSGTTSEDGWFSIGDADHFSIILGFTQAVTTGGITYKVECRESYLGRKSPVVLVAGETTVTTFPATARVNVRDERYAECRIGMKIVTDDTPGGDTGANQEKITAWLEKGSAR